MSSIGNCSICHENVKMAEFGILRNCPHGFHRQCIEHWLRQNNSCPLCRSAACVRDIFKPIIDPPVMPANVDQLTMPFKFDSNELKKNKMDSANCAPGLGLAMNDLLVTRNDGIGWKCARAILPVPKLNRNATEAYIAFYFEGHIKKISPRGGGVGMGFCSYQFPLQGNYYIGCHQNSIGIFGKIGMFNCGKWESCKCKEARDPFKAGDKIGLGLIYEPKNASTKCFAICNRKLLVSVELPASFFDVPIFPVVGLSAGSIQLNFGQEDWDFDPHQIIPLIQ